MFYVANESPVPAGEVFTPGDFLDRIKAAHARGFVSRDLYFDTSVRAFLDLTAALDALCNKEDDRYMKGIPAGTFTERFAQLLALSGEQMQSIEAALKGNATAAKTVRMCTDFLMNYIFTFMKCFDANRSFDDPANYYMEREWRVGNNVQFKLEDVARVFFPSKFSRQFRADLPDYAGQVTFVD